MAEERVEFILAVISADDMGNHVRLMGETFAAHTALRTVPLQPRHGRCGARVIETMEERLSWRGR